MAPSAVPSDARLRELEALLPDRFELVRPLGRGGMSSVWEARDRETRRSVALKVIDLPAEVEDDVRRGFVREARAALTVDHPNALRVLDAVILADGRPALVTELLRGETLRIRLEREGKLTPRQISDVFSPVISVLAHLHSRGVVHRDLKPANVFLAEAAPEQTMVKVLDFGLAMLTDQDLPPNSEEPSGPAAGFGTPTYMAPEQALASAVVNHRADYWSLGVMLYEACAGVRPIPGRHARETLKNLALGNTTPLRTACPDAPEVLVDVCERLLQRDPADRPDDIQEVLRLIHDLGREPVASSPVSSQAASSRLSCDPMPEVHVITRDTVLPTEPDFESQIEQTPPSYVVKGMFFTRFKKVLGDQWGATLERLQSPPRFGRFMPFSDYRQADYTRVVCVAARLRYPGLALGEGIRRIAREDFDVFADSTFGRVFLSRIADVHTSLLMLADVYPITATGDWTVSAKEDGPNTVVFRFERHPGTWEYQVGQMESICIHFGATYIITATFPGTHIIEYRVDHY